MKGFLDVSHKCRKVEKRCKGVAPCCHVTLILLSINFWMSCVRLSDLETQLRTVEMETLAPITGADQSPVSPPSSRETR